jgi:hypothetical protein
MRCALVAEGAAFQSMMTARPGGSQVVANDPVTTGSPRRMSATSPTVVILDGPSLTARALK